MTTKYEACFGSVSAVEVERETAESVWIGGRRRAKDSSWRPLFDSAEAAWESLVYDAERSVEAAETNLAHYRQALSAIKAKRDAVLKRRAESQTRGATK